MPTPVIEIVSSVNNTALKHWLRLHKKKHSASNKEALALLIEKQLDKGELSEEELESAACEIDEYGNKRVYLRGLGNKTLLSKQDKFEAHLEDLRVPLSSRLKRGTSSSSRPKLVYAYWSPDEVRIAYIETHTYRQADLRLGQIISIDKPARVIISADIKSELLRVFMDPPGQVHAHTNDGGLVSEKAYEDFYMAKAEQFVGKFDHIDLFEPMEKLVKLDPPIFELRRNKVVDDDNFECTYHGPKNLRQSRSYRAAIEDDSKPCTYKNSAGYWLSSASGGALLRNIGMQVHTAEGMLKFPAHCVADEVGYAISTITTL